MQKKNPVILLNLYIFVRLEKHLIIISHSVNSKDCQKAGPRLRDAAERHLHSRAWVAFHWSTLSPAISGKCYLWFKKKKKKNSSNLINFHKIFTNICIIKISWFYWFLSIKICFNDPLNNKKKNGIRLHKL